MIALYHKLLSAAALAAVALLSAACSGYLPSVPLWPAASASTAPAFPTPSPGAPRETPKPYYFPERPITLLVGAPRGSMPDLAARLLIPRLEKTVTQPVVVANRPEGEGLDAWMQLKQATPDGYTMGLLSSPQVEAMALDPQQKAPFAMADFVPLAGQVQEPMAIFTRSSGPFNAVEDLLAAARTQSAGIAIAVPVDGAAENQAAAELQRKAGSKSKLRVIAFVDATSVAMAVLSGQVDVGVRGFRGLLPLAGSGQVRLLAILDDKRLSEQPQVPTLRERGVDVVSYATLGYAVPKYTAGDIADFLAWSIYIAASDPDQQSRMKEAGLPLRFMDAQQYGRFLAEEGERVKQSLGANWRGKGPAG